jgi:elongation factor G
MEGGSMKVYEAHDIRNVAVVGHGGAGKTSLTSALLFAAGAVTRLGKVDDGNTVTDHDEEAIARKKSIAASACYMEWNKTKINAIDTPGYGDFIHEARASMRVVESAIVVVDAVHGVEVNTERAWGYADEFGVARIIVINRMDKERASFARSVESLQEHLSRACMPAQIPIGEEKEFKGVVDLVRMKALVFPHDESGKFEEQEIPGNLSEAATSAREKLMESIAECDDELMEIYFDKGSLSEEEFVTGLGKAVRSGKLYPIYLAAGPLNIGTTALLDAIVNLLPSPASRPEVTGANPSGDGEITVKSGVDEPASAFVFKTIIDPFAGKISFFRVYSGKISGDGSYQNVAKGETERMGGVSLAQGKSIEAVTAVASGDIGAVSKLKVTATGDTLADKSLQVVYQPVRFPDPAIAWAIEPKTRADEEKISATLHKLLDADPMLRTSRDPQTHEMLISGAGQEHVEVMLSKMRRQGVEATLKLPKIPYRETITKPVKYVEYTHKKQTGGAGQYARVAIDIEPIPGGDGYEFVDKIVGGVIDQQFRPSVDKGVRSKMTEGVVAGYPVSGVRVSLVDGKTHPVDSKDIAFQVAGREAFKKAVMDARPVLLEPIMNVTIVIPEECMGDVVGDLNSRRGRVAGMDPKGHSQIIKCTAPLAEMLTYPATLNSLTSGRGSFTMELASYEQVPPHLQDKIVADAKAAEGAGKEAG